MLSTLPVPVSSSNRPAEETQDVIHQRQLETNEVTKFQKELFKQIGVKLLLTNPRYQLSA